MNNKRQYCHDEDLDQHVCKDSSECKYGQPDGPDDYITECDCYFEEDL